MPWQTKKPDLKNNPLYLEPKVNELTTQMAQRVQDTLLDVVSRTNLKIGEIVKTTGFYSIGDGGEAVYSVQDLSGSEIWYDTGLGFSLSSYGEIKAGTKKLKYVIQNGVINVKHFGAKGDYDDDLKTGTDNTVVLQKVFDFAYVPPIDSSLVRYDCPTVLFPSSYGYCITETVYCREGIPIDMTSSTIVLIADGLTPKKALVIGQSTARSYNVDYKVDVRRSTYLTTLDENDCGVEFINPYYCHIYIKGTRHFSVGARLVGDTKGAVYNTVNLGFLAGSNIFLDVIGRNAGWGNENLFIGGEFMNGYQSAVGVRIKNDSGSYVYSDNNLFIKPSFELNAAVGHTALPFLIQDATSTKVIAMRLEDLNDRSPYVARFTGVTENSDIEVSAGGDGIWSIDDQSKKKTNYAHGQRWNFANKGKEIFSTEALHKKACYYDGSTTVHVPELHFIQLDMTAISPNKNAITIDTKGLTMPSSRGVGRFIDTSKVKKFVIQGQADAGLSYYVRCYDSAGNVLLPTETNVYAHSGNDGLIIATGGNAYWTSPTSTSLAIAFSADVAYAGVYVGNGTNIRGFSISAVEMKNQYASTWAGYEEIQKGVNIGTAPPTVGTWQKGRRIVNANPTAGQPKAWICTATGTPGTWVSEGNL
jgi:hypothetical protein